MKSCGFATSTLKSPTKARNVLFDVLKEKIKCRCYVTNTVKYQERE